MNDMGITNILERLGLTEYEAKVLSALFRLKESGAPDISRSAQVPKTRVYDVLDRLIKKGVIIEIYGRPKRYRVIDASDVFEGLISKKKQEIASLEQKALELKDFIETWDVEYIEKGEKVMKVKDKNDFVKILSQEIDNAEKEVVAITRLGREHDVLKKAIERASNRDVTVKLVSDIESHTDMVQSFEKAGADIKHYGHAGMNAFIIDQEKIILGLSDFNKDKREYHFAMWNNNEAMANSIKHYFDNCWSQGKKK